MIKSVVFDIDGTMLDTERAILNTFRDTLRELKPELAELPDLTFTLGIPSDDSFRQLGITDIEHADEVWMNYYIQKHARHISLFDGIETVIKELKNRGYKLGIVTSKSRAEYDNDFSPLGLDGYFDTVICMEETTLHKPHPEPMLKYLELSGSNKEETLFIGDTIYDSECASGAGVHFALAVWGAHNIDKIHADYYFKSPGDILSAEGMVRPRH